MDSGSVDNHSESHSASNRMQLNAGHTNASLSPGTAGIDRDSGISVRSPEILDIGRRGYGRVEAERQVAQTEAEDTQDNTKSFGTPAPAPEVETSHVNSQHEYAVRSSTDNPSTSQTYPPTTSMQTNIIPAATEIPHPVRSGGYTASLNNSHSRHPATYSTPEYQTQPSMQPTRSLPAASSTLGYQSQSPMQPTRSLPAVSSRFPLQPSTGATAGSQPQSYSVRPYHSEPAAFYGSTDAHNRQHPFTPAPVRRPTAPPGLFNAYVANDPFKPSISHRVNSRYEDVTTFDDIPVFAESHSQPVGHQYPPAPYPPFQQPLSQAQRPSSQVQYPSGAQSHSLPAPNTQLPSSSRPTRHDGGSMPPTMVYTPPNQGRSSQPPVIPYIPPAMETYEPLPWSTHNRLSQVPLGTYPQGTYDPSAQIPIIQEPSAHFPMSTPPPIANGQPPLPSNSEPVRPTIPPIRPMDPQIGVYQPPYDPPAPTSPVNRPYDPYDLSYIPFIPPVPNQYPPPTFVNDDDKSEPGIFKKIVVGLVQIPKLLFKSRLDSYHNNSATAPLMYTPHSYAPYEEKTEGTWKYIVVFAFHTLPEQVYLHLLLRLPSLYFGRVARIFEEADMTLPEIKKMALETASRGKNAPFANMNFEPENVPPAYESLKHTWENFIDSVMREWKTFNIVSVLLLSAILTILQIESAAADPVTRYTALFSLICALISLLYGCMYIIRFGSMRKTYKAAEWALEAKKSKTVIWWNVWVLLAMPAIWLTWSIILYIVCIMSFIWRTGSRDDQPPEALSAEAAMAVRIVITVVLCLGTLYGILIVTTFRQYGDAMDRAWKNRIDGWLMEKPFSSYRHNVYPTSYHQPSHYPIFGDSYTQAPRPYQSTVPAWNRPPSPSLYQYGGYPVARPTQGLASPQLQPLRYVPEDSYGFDRAYKYEINPDSSRSPTYRTPYSDLLPEVGLTKSDSMNSTTTTVVPSGIHPTQHKDWNIYINHPIPGDSQSRSRSPSPSPPPLPPRPWVEDPLPAENLTSNVLLTPISRNRDTASPYLPTSNPSTSNPSISRDSPLLRDDNLREARVHFRSPLSSSDHNAPTLDTDTTSQASAQPSELHDRH